MDFQREISGQDLRQWRRDCTLTQPQAALLLGYTKRQIQKWEKDVSPIRTGLKWALYGYALSKKINAEIVKKINKWPITGL